MGVGWWGWGHVVGSGVGEQPVSNMYKIPDGLQSIKLFPVGDLTGIVGINIPRERLEGPESHKYSFFYL